MFLTYALVMWTHSICYPVAGFSQVPEDSSGMITSLQGVAKRLVGGGPRLQQWIIGLHTWKRQRGGSLDVGFSKKKGF